jgi:hypothetical protein
MVPAYESPLQGRSEVADSLKHSPRGKDRSTAHRPPRQVHWPDWSRNKLSPAHLKIYQSNAKKVLLNCGRAFGKDHILFLRGLRLAFRLYARRTKSKTWIRYGPVVEMAVYAPVRENFAGLWRRFKQMLPEIPGVAPGGGEMVKISDKDGDEGVELFGPNGIVITFFSVWREASSRGNGFDILLGTEVGYGKEATLTGNLLRLVRRPNYAGYVMLNCTPIEPNHWWDKAIAAARRPEDHPKSRWKNYELHEGTFCDNPTSGEQDWEEFQESKEANVFSCRREWLAWLDQPNIDDSVLDLDDESCAFKRDEVNACLISLPIEVSGPNYAGTDLAWSGKDNYFTIVIDDPTGLIIYCKAFPKMSDPEIVKHFQEVERDYRPIKHTFDANGPLAQQTQGKLKGIGLNPVTTSTKYAGDDTKAEMCKHTKQHFLERSILIKNPETYPGMSAKEKQDTWLLIRELYEYLRLEIVKEVVEKGRVTRRVYVTYTKRPGPGHSDDGVDALVLCNVPRRVPIRGKHDALPDHEVWGD